MRFTRLEISDFLSYHHEVLDLGAVRYASVVGPNGAGKSAVPQAIVWALYGKHRVGNDHDSVVRDGASVAEVILDLEVAGASWRVVRTRDAKRGRGAVRLMSMVEGQWATFGDHRSRTAQDQIVEVVGLSADAYHSVALMDQSSTSGGTKLTSADSNTRRNILIGMIPELARWEEVAAAARERRLAASRTLELAEDRAHAAAQREEDAKERLDSMPDVEPDAAAEQAAAAARALAEATARTAASSAQRAGEVERAAREGDRLQAMERALAVARREHHREVEAESEAVAAEKAARRRCAELEVEIPAAAAAARAADAAADAAEDDAKAAAQGASRREGAVGQVRERVRASEAEVARARKSMAGLHEQDREAGRCWVCDSRVSPATYDELNDGLHEDLAAARKEAASAGARLESLIERGERDRQDVAAARKVARNADVAAERALAGLAALRAQAAALEGRPAHRPRSRELERSAADLEEDAQALEIARSAERARAARTAGSDSGQDGLGDLADLRAAAASAREHADAAERAAGVRSEVVAGARAAGKARRAALAEVAGLRADLARLAWMSEACGPKGVPSFLLDSVLGAVEERQNEILASLEGSEPMSVTFSQHRERKGDGGAADALDIIVRTASGASRPIESFSLGERVRLTISNIFAMLAVFNERRGVSVQTLILDEPLGPLDDVSVPAFVDVLRAAMSGGVVESVYVVTHDQRVVDALPQSLRVRKDESEGSRVDVLL